jgi:hypothetical protein
VWEQEDISPRKHRKRVDKLEYPSKDLSGDRLIREDWSDPPSKFSAGESVNNNESASAPEDSDERTTESNALNDVSDGESELDLDLYLSGLDELGMVPSTNWEEQFRNNHFMKTGLKWPQMEETSESDWDHGPVLWHPFDPEEPSVEGSEELLFDILGGDSGQDLWAARRVSQGAVCLGMVRSPRHGLKSPPELESKDALTRRTDS